LKADHLLNLLNLLIRTWVSLAVLMSTAVVACLVVVVVMLSILPLRLFCLLVALLRSMRTRLFDRSSPK